MEYQFQETCTDFYYIYRVNVTSILLKSTKEIVNLKIQTQTQKHLSENYCLVWAKLSRKNMSHPYVTSP